MIFFRISSLLLVLVVSGIVSIEFDCVLTTNLLNLNSSIDHLMLDFSPASLPKNALGKPPTAVVAIVEISITAPIKNQLAWISIPASKVLMMIFLGFKASFPVKLLTIEKSTSHINPKLAKFFIIFHIFQR